MDILKTFEIFLQAPVSFIHKRNIKIMHVETNIFAQKLPVTLTFDENINLTVYNNRKMYNLISSVVYKRKMKNENKECEIFDKRADNKRVS